MKRSERRAPQRRLPPVRRAGRSSRPEEPSPPRPPRPVRLAELRLEGHHLTRRLSGTENSADSLWPLWSASVLPRLAPLKGEDLHAYFMRCMQRAFPTLQDQHWSLRTSECGAVKLCLTVTGGNRVYAQRTWKWLEALHPAAPYTVLQALRQGFPGCWTALTTLEHIQEFHWDAARSHAQYLAEGGDEEDQRISDETVRGALGAGMLSEVPLKAEELLALRQAHPALERLLALLEMLEASEPREGGMWEEGEVLYPVVLITDSAPSDDRWGLILEFYEEAHAPYMQTGEDVETLTFDLEPRVLLALGAQLRRWHAVLGALWEAFEAFEEQGQDEGGVA